MRIVVLDGFSVDQGELSWDDLGQLGEVTVHARTAPHEVVPRATGATAVLTNKVLLTRAVLEQLPDLAYVGIVATGTKADDTNVTGKRIVNPYAFDASGDEDERPMKANTQENA